MVANILHFPKVNRTERPTLSKLALLIYLKLWQGMFDIIISYENAIRRCYMLYLLRFSSYFVESKLGDAGITTLKSGSQEVNAVHHRQKKIDKWRILQVEQAISDKEHPFNHLWSGWSSNLALL